MAAYSVIELCIGCSEAARTSFLQAAIAAGSFPLPQETVVMLVLWGFLANDRRKGFATA